MAYCMDWPATTGFVPQVAVSVRLALEDTGVLMVDVLSAGTGSATGLEMVAVPGIAPVTLVNTVPLIKMVALAPLASVPISSEWVQASQVVPLLIEYCGALIYSLLMKSVTFTWLASLGPALARLNLYSIGCPATTGEVLQDFTMDRLADWFSGVSIV